MEVKASQIPDKMLGYPSPWLRCWVMFTQVWALTGTPAGSWVLKPRPQCRSWWALRETASLWLQWLSALSAPTPASLGGGLSLASQHVSYAPVLCGSQRAWAFKMQSQEEAFFSLLSAEEGKTTNDGAWSWGDWSTSQTLSCHKVREGLPSIFTGKNIQTVMFAIHILTCLFKISPLMVFLLCCANSACPPLMKLHHRGPFLSL